MSLCPEYYIDCNYGTLIVRPAGKIAGFWLRNDNGVFCLSAEKENRFNQLMLPFNHIRQLEPLKQLLQNISPRIMRGMSQFKSGQRGILRFCINGGLFALELVEDCPALAYLIVYRLIPKTPTKTLADGLLIILEQKRGEILARMNWPSDKGVIKLLRKIPAQECCADLFHDLRKLLTSGNQNKIKLLRHLPVLNRYVVKLLNDKELSLYFANSFYKELSQIDLADDPPEGWEVLDFKKYLIDAITNGFHLSPLRSLADLDDLHGKFITWLANANFNEKIKDLVFPPPPLPKTIIKIENNEQFGVFPIETGADLWREGVEMNHCIAGFAQDIDRAKGWRYAYHVNLPGEPPATLMIRSYGDDWEIEGLQGKHNTEVSSSVDHWVNNWLTSQTCQLRDD